MLVNKEVKVDLASLSRSEILALSQNGKLVYVVSDALKTLLMFSLESGDVIDQVTIADGSIRQLSSNEKYLIVESINGDYKIYSIPLKQLIGRIDAFYDNMRVKLSPNCQYIACYRKGLSYLTMADKNHLR